MPGFQQFDRASVRYLSDLATNNTKDWFEANRARYDAEWKTPALDLIEALAPSLQAMQPQLQAVPKIGGALRRIHRDTRFSADKTPYAAQMHLAFEVAGPKGQYRGMHLVLHPDRLGFGAGQYGLSSPELERFRARVSNPKHRARLLAAAAQAESAGSAWDAPDLKRLPAGFAADPEWEHLLRRKSVILRGETKGLPDWLFTPAFLPEIERLIAAFLPLIGWLSET